MNNHTGIYENLKSGELYVVLFSAICTDNGKEDTFRIIYRKLQDDGKIFDRDSKEFLEKFKFCYITKKQ